MPEGKNGEGAQEVLEGMVRLGSLVLDRME